MTVFFAIATQNGCSSSKLEDNTSSTTTEPNIPDQIVTCAAFTYACYNGVWYTYFDGVKGDRLDLNHITARLIGGADLNNFSFSAVGLPELTVNRVVADNFYELDVTEGCDPFHIAQTLWDSGEFELIQFNFFIGIDAARS